MLCVTGSEKDAHALEARLEGCARRLRPAAFLQEIRLDLIEPPLEEVFGLLARHASRAIVCCRPKRQGGAFDGSEDDRLRLLGRAARATPAFVDLEADCDDASLRRLREAGASSLLLSWHDHQGLAPDLEHRFDAMARRGTEALKVAVAVDDAVQLQRLRELRLRASLPCVIIGIGFAGLLSRCRYPAFGSPWTYVAVDQARATAAGQLSLDRALAWGLPHGASAPFIALLGGPQIAHSPGPRVYNSLFRARGRPWTYLPLQTSDTVGGLRLLRDLGASGASVTMPHKITVTECGEADGLVRRVGAANTVRFSAYRVELTNTDVAGIAQPLGAAIARLSPRPSSALILGAGGAARAALVACEQLGLSCAISARNHDSARTAIGDGGTAVPWSRRDRHGAEVLINATPVTAVDSSPWPRGSPLDKRIVFDLALAGEPSALLAQARAEGAQVLTPEQMWFAQGAAQITLITGEPCTAAELARLAKDAR